MRGAHQHTAQEPQRDALVRESLGTFVPCSHFALSPCRRPIVPTIWRVWTGERMSEESKIVVSDSSIKIQNLEITRKEVADYLRLVKEDERVQAFVKAVEVGVFCLERAAASQDTEFVRRQVESLLNRRRTKCWLRSRH